jgi:lysophospholipase L1-like esterase
MSDSIKVSSAWPVNELGEVLFDVGTGSDNVGGFLSQDLLPVNAITGKASIKVPRGSRYKRGGRKATRQVSSRMATAANGAVGYTYHNNITVEADVIAIRPTFNNVHTAALTGVTFAVAPTTDFSNPIVPTGAWVNGTSGVGSSSSLTVAARLAAEQPSLTRPDWVFINSVAPSDGVSLRRFCVRHFVPAANATTSEGFYALDTVFHTPNSINAGRVFQTYRQDVDGVTSKAAFTNTTPQSKPGLIMGWDYMLASGEIITIAASGDSITEGAVNGAIGNFGNGWAYQAIRLFRERHPQILIEYANYGLSGQNTATFNPVIIERLPRIEPDLLLYSPFSVNDGTPTTSTINNGAVLSSNLQTAARTSNVPTIYVGGCPNTLQNWTIAQDGVRRLGNMFYRGEFRMSCNYIDTDIDLWDGVKALKPEVTDDLTHPNEYGAGLVAKNQVLPALERAILG